MATAMDTFYNSYLKKFKRPEFQSYKPDQSFGANMLHGSEETNPWAGRDQSNAKFGFLGGNNNGGGSSGGGGDNLSSFLTPAIPTLPAEPAPSVDIPAVINQVAPGMAPQIMANYPSQINTAAAMLRPQQQQPSALAQIGTPLMDIGAKVGANALTDLITRPKTFDALSPMMEGFASKALSPVAETATNLFDSGTGLGGFDKIGGELTKSSTEALSNAIEGTAEGVGSTVSSALPVVGTGLTLAKDLISGKLLRRPAESIGGAGGALGGAALGASLGSVVPGVGNAVGALLGALLGGKGGGLLGSVFGRLFK
jgi:hypothetical protein